MLCIVKGTHVVDFVAERHMSDSDEDTIVPKHYYTLLIASMGLHIDFILLVPEGLVVVVS